jgi:dihydroorotate dehydrogenase electron transfer subunit
MKTQPIKEVKARIQQHRKIGPGYFRLLLLCPEIARVAQPGQFMMLRVSELRDLFLRRPFSFSRIFPPRGKTPRGADEGSLEVCYQVVGRGTSLMTQMREGQRLDVLGPLGNGFWAVEGRQRAILVGGGIGVAPLLPWAEQLQGERKKKKKVPRSPEQNPEVLFLIGGKSRDKILGMRELKKMGCEPQVATEDGSLGMQGLATDLLDRELMTQGAQSTSLYACGPLPMLAKVAQIADQFDLPCQVLMEARMACGVGACLGCAVKVKEPASGRTSDSEDATTAGEQIVAGGNSGGGEMGSTKETLFPVITELAEFRYARACKEGPVFEAKEILWE